MLINWIMKGNKTNSGSYRSITFLSTTGKAFCKLLNDRIVEYWKRRVGSVRVKQDSDGVGVRRSHVHSRLFIQGRKNAGLKM